MRRLTRYPVRPCERQGAALAGNGLGIEKAFGVNIDMLLRMQAWHDANAMRRQTGEIHVERYRPPSAEPC